MFSLSLSHFLPFLSFPFPFPFPFSLPFPLPSFLLSFCLIYWISITNSFLNLGRSINLFSVHSNILVEPLPEALWKRVYWRECSSWGLHVWIISFLPSHQLVLWLDIICYVVDHISLEILSLYLWSSNFQYRYWKLQWYCEVRCHTDSGFFVWDLFFFLWKILGPCLYPWYSEIQWWCALV